VRKKTIPPYLKERLIVLSGRGGGVCVFVARVLWVSFVVVAVYVVCVRLGFGFGRHKIYQVDVGSVR